MLLKSELEFMMERLEALKHLAWHPLLLPLVLVELRTGGTPNDLMKVRDSLYRIEKTTGTHKNYHRQSHHEGRGYYARGDEVWNRSEFELAPGELTSIASDCALFDARCQINEQLLNWIGEMNEALSAEVTDPQTGFLVQSKTLLNEKISFMKTSLKNNRIRSLYLGKRAEVQVQAVSRYPHCGYNPLITLTARCRKPLARLLLTSNFGTSA
jgi:hypothetical protein